MAKSSTSKAASASTTPQSSKAAAKSKVKAKQSSIGAPVQLNQTSRKGKKAWRKNVDIEQVEQGLEEIRAEERVVGTAVQNLKDDDLFQIDVKGDDNARHHLPKFNSSQLTSAKILAQRSAVPAVFSRPSQKRKAGYVTREEKDRLLRIAKRPRKGPFNSIQDPSELESGSGTTELSEAVKQSGSYDAWEEEPVVELADGMEAVHKKKVKPPVFAKPRDRIEVPAVEEPHQGASYNPPVEAHQELLIRASEIESKKVAELAKMAETKTKMAGALREDTEYDLSVPAGMTLDARVRGGGGPDEEESDEEDIDDRTVLHKPTKMKTTAQKNRAARIAAEQRTLQERLANKKLLASIEQARSIRKTAAKATTEREQLRLAQRLALQEKLKKKGMSGQKLGRHKVPETEVEVQLGEDLSESLRGLKPEGNLFRDRFRSLQQRALIEPRAIVLPKRRKLRVVEYEKHAWKRFE